MRKIQLFLCMVFELVVMSSTGAAQPQSNPWVAVTLLDLQGIHDIMRDNHPGPVDSENSRYAKWLEEGLKRASMRAQSVKSYSDYTRVLNFYTNGARLLDVLNHARRIHLDWRRPGNRFPCVIGAIEIFARPAVWCHFVRRDNLHRSSCCNRGDYLIRMLATSQ